MKQKRCILREAADRGAELLRDSDPALYDLLVREHERQGNTLSLIAAAGIADLSVLACQSSLASNVTTEGYPGSRFHAGCEVVDEIERLAVARAKELFGARYANVQPHSGTSANQVVIFSLLEPGDAILGMGLDSGGHLTHGSRASVTGQYFDAYSYGLDSSGFIHYEEAHDLAMRHRPRLIICGASAYPRTIDFERFRRIADEAGALLLADISHVAGLVAAGEHSSPIDHAHFTTTSTYKQLGGPRGGLILMGKDYQEDAPNGRQTLSESIQSAVFPFFQGTPNLSAIAAKARALAMAATAEFKEIARRVVVNGAALARYLLDKGYSVVTHGTDNHIVLVDVSARGMTGVVAERALEECNILINRNKIPGDRLGPQVASGIRLGTNESAWRRFSSDEMLECADLIDQALSSITLRGKRGYEIDPAVRESVRARVAHLCHRFPVPRYPKVQLP